MHEIKQHLLKANESKKNLRGHTFSWDKEQWKHNISELMECSKSISKRDVPSNNNPIYKEMKKKKSQNKNWTLCLMQWEKANWAKS